MFLHTAKTALYFLFRSAHQRGIYSFVCLKLCLNVYLKLYPLFSPSESHHTCLFTLLHHCSLPLLIYSIYKSFRVSKIQFSLLVIPFLLPLTNILFNIPTLNFLHFPLRCLSISFLNLDLAPMSILKLLF